MAEPRKVFRIEETAAAQLEQGVEATQTGLLYAEMLQQLNALRATLAAAPPRQSGESAAPQGAGTARLTSELNLIHGAIRGGTPEPAARNGSRAQPASMTRIAHELDAVVNGTEQATQKILAAAEAIDQAASNLSAALKGKLERDAAQDIQDLIIQIFEACNFQDLIGQRVTKVMTTLKFIEDHITRVLDEIKNPAARRDGTQSLHGPRLEIDRGHATQGDIDAMFHGPG